MKNDDATTIVIAGVTLYFIGYVGLFTNWNSHQTIDVAYSVTSGLGLLTTCVGILLIENYRLFKAFALVGVVLILTFGYTWVVHR
jgi:multidrug transporter EmrE-like cation transporter